MDPQTIAAYDADAARYAADWRDQDAPAAMHALLRRFFTPGPTADIGCGAGRDTAWLAANGFDACGFDASQALLHEARAAHPGIAFACATLPALEDVPKGHYQNVLCETVIMHLDPSQVGAAVHALRALLRPSGTLSLSWRVTGDASLRDAAGRLYAAVDPLAVTGALDARDAILFDEEDVSLSSGKRVRRLIVRLPAGDDPFR